MTGIRYITLLSLILCSFAALSQDSINTNLLKPGECKRYAMNAMKQGDFHAAAQYLEAYLKHRPSNYKMAYKLAESYKINRDYLNAEKWYRIAYEKGGEKHTKALFYLAQMQKSNGNCAGAKENFLKFKKEISGQQSDELTKLKKLLKAEIAGCDSLSSQKKLLHKILVTRLDTSVNMAHTEHSPLTIDSVTLLYNSLRSNKKEFVNLEDTSYSAYRKFYLAKKENNEWKFSGEFPLPGGDDNVNSSSGAFSPGGNRFYFTKCRLNNKSKMICALYVSEKQAGGTWGEPEKLPKSINNPKFTSTMPTVGSESRQQLETVYFISDREGTKGGYDIWYFTYDPKKKKNPYKGPRNCGTKVNSVEDEITPFYDMETRSLYFSSKSWPGMGGFDIFRSYGELRQFSEPRNIGMPVNSENDDIYYAEGVNREEGFFVSNRKGGTTLNGSSTCCDDLYAFKRLEYVKLNIKGTVTVNEDSVPRPLQSRISLFIKPSEGDPILVRTVETSKDGTFDVKIESGNDYQIVSEKEGYLSGSYTFSTRDITENKTLEKNFEVSKILSDKTFVLKNVYYATDKHHLSDQSQNAIDTTLLVFLNENPTAVVEISSHTDNVASDSYNMGLSQRRADGVVKYLISKGIAPERLIAKGYGESKPIADNSTDEGKAQNRRTEFKVTGELAKKIKNPDEDRDDE